MDKLHLQTNNNFKYVLYSKVLKTVIRLLTSAITITTNEVLPINIKLC